MKLRGGFLTTWIFNYRRWGYLFALAVGLTACIPTGLSMPQSPLLRSLERKSGLIVYVGVDGNIYTIDQGGTRQTTLSGSNATPEPEAGQEKFFQFPAWSPDGRKVAFVGFVSDGSIINDVTLYTASRNGQDVQEVWKSGNQYPFYLYWSPDGKNLGFLSSEPGADRVTLQMVPASGGEAQVLGEGAPFYWDWSPDNRRLLVHSSEPTAIDGESSLAFLNLRNNGGEPVETKIEIRTASFQAPAYSPDGDELLMAGKTGQEEHDGLLLLDKEGNLKRELATIDGPVAFEWSPNGKRVAYMTAINGASPESTGSLVVLDPQDPEGTPTSIEDKVVAFFWSPNSERIAYFTPGLTLPTASPDGSSPPPSSPELLLNMFVLDVDSGKSISVATFKPTESFLTFISYFDQYQRSATIWSPDSRNLVVAAARNEGGPGIFIVEAAGNLQPRYLAEGLMATWSTK